MMNWDRGGACVVFGIAVAAVLALVGCGPGGAPVVAAPGEGDADDETRVVVLSPALAVTMVDLGLEDLVVGRHGYDLALRESLAVCGDQAGIDAERLLEVNPTHVLVEWGSRDLPPNLMSLAGSNGWSLSNYQLLTLDHVARAADDLHQRFVIGLDDAVGGEVDDGLGRAERGPPAAVVAESRRVRPSDRMAAAWSVREDRPRFEGRVLLLAGVEPIGALGPGSAHHELLERVGGVPAIVDGGPWVTLDAEDVLELAPDAIVLFSPRAPGTAPALEPAGPSDVAARLGRLGEMGVPAVAQGRLVVIDHPFGLLPSTALIDVGEELRGVLERWAE